MRYTAAHAYRAERDGDTFGPWEGGEEIDLEPADCGTPSAPRGRSSLPDETPSSRSGIDSSRNDISSSTPGERAEAGAGEGAVRAAGREVGCGPAGTRP